MHLQIEATGGVVSRLESPEVIGRYLYRLTDMAAMQSIAEPVIRSLPGGGYAGILILAESHASIHTVGGAAWVDLFSCKDLPVRPEVVVEDTQLMFGFTAIRYRVLARGLETLG